MSALERPEGVEVGLGSDLLSAPPLVVGATERWYQEAVFYELHVRSFSDSDGDGIGDFRGLTAKLDYLLELGVTVLWLLPFYPSPLRDDGYDIADYRHVHPSYGSMRDFRVFLRQAHDRGLRVVTELVLAHTSDQHPWFQRARQARPGTTQRDFYIWSDTPDRFSDARVIFKDFESSNWSHDPVAEAYYWHRFYSHQPSLNYDNPAVREAMFDVVDHWLGLGVDGLRLDAVPYLFAREGTSCENLPETLDFLRQLRTHVDERFEDRMLLAEANQWPEDAVAYMGKGDMCHMAFNFPLMPRMFMAARQEDRFPIIDIMAETPAAPEGCQWALFLRNHDELTLEMVTDEERDYMYTVYAQDPQARVNVGIRRRLAPLLGNDRNLIEMMNGLLFSLPGTPIVYYGDEIGMGDNIYLGDRNAVRTPMQWDSDRNAGFSSANPQRLFLPVIIDPGYHAQAVNVEAQEENPSSLLWWMRRLIHLRHRYRAFGIGTFEHLRQDNRKVLAFVRRHEDELLLVVVNLSRFAQCVELDLSEHQGATPVELFGNMAFPPIGDLPYFITLGPHGFYWFSLEFREEREQAPRPTLVISRPWTDLFDERQVGQLERVLPAFISQRRWFSSKTRLIKAASVVDAIAVPPPEHLRGGPVGYLLVVNVELDQGNDELYIVPVAFAGGARAEELRRWHADAVIAELEADGHEGVLYDAVWDSDFGRALFEIIGRRRTLSGFGGRMSGVPLPGLRGLRANLDADATAVPLAAEQSNSSLVLGDRLILKIIRRVEPGAHPGVELGRFLGERARFTHAPRVGGSIEYRRSTAGWSPMVIGSLEELVPNEGDGWSYVVDALEHNLEEAVAHDREEKLDMPPPLHLLDVVSAEPPTGHILLGPHLGWASLLGQRTGELHRALASDRLDPAMAPEPMSPIVRQSLYHGARSLLRRILRQIASLDHRSPLLEAVLDREGEIGERLQVMTRVPLGGQRIRGHGDYHLGQVLWTGKDFMIIDFEGEPARSLGQRRLKRPAAVDLAGMVRSFHYASRSAAMRLSRDFTDAIDPWELEHWLSLWYRWVSGTFLRTYLEAVQGAGFLPPDLEQLAQLLDFFLLEKAVYELGYEANSRPDWVDIPAQGILDILDAGP